MTRDVDDGTSSSPSTPLALQAKVEWDDDRQEPYIPIPGQPDFRLTPLRRGDEDHVVRLCNDPTIGPWAYRRAFPYTRPHAEWWINHIIPQHPHFFPQVHEALRTGAPPPIHELRVVLRHVPVDSGGGTNGHQLGERASKAGLGSDEILGSLHLWPSEYEGLREAEMLALPAGEQVWEIAYDVLPALQGRGLGRGMIQAAMDAWVKWLGIGKVIAIAQVVNAASGAVAAKCGFKEEKRFVRQWPEEKGGGEKEMIRWIWTAGVGAHPP